MNSQVIKIQGKDVEDEDSIVVKAKFDDIKVYEKFIYWLIDLDVSISPAKEEDIEDVWDIKPLEYGT